MPLRFTTSGFTRPTSSESGPTGSGLSAGMGCQQLLHLPVRRAGHAVSGRREAESAGERKRVERGADLHVVVEVDVDVAAARTLRCGWPDSFRVGRLAPVAPR